VQSPRRAALRAATAREAGFTIVELVLVIAIIAFLAAVAGPRLLAIGAMKADLSQSEVLAALRYAQRLAVATGCGVQVQLTASSYTLTQQTGCAGVMIARGSYGQPWIFHQVKDLLAGRPKRSAPTVAERFGIALDHVQAAMRAERGTQVSRRMAARVPTRK